MEKIKILWKKFKGHASFSKLKSGFTFKEGGKVRIRFEHLVKVISVTAAPLLIVYFFRNGENSSYIGHSPSSLINEKSLKGQSNGSSGGHGNMSFGRGSVVNQTKISGSHKGVRAEPIKLSAKQIVVREDGSLGNGFHIGSNLIGELQSTIDTRDSNQLVRVLLPFGAQSKDGSQEIPKGTLLMGQVSYPGKGEKIFINFSQAIFPEGKPIKMAGQALDPKDYSTGLTGAIQSQAAGRSLSLLGLSMVSAMGDVLTEKEALGQGYNVTPKANMKNAVMAGVSKTAEIEANRFQEQTQTPDFVRVEAGTVVIISLTNQLVL